MLIWVLCEIFKKEKKMAQSKMTILKNKNMLKIRMFAPGKLFGLKKMLRSRCRSASSSLSFASVVF